MSKTFIVLPDNFPRDSVEEVIVTAFCADLKEKPILVSQLAKTELLDYAIIRPKEIRLQIKPEDMVIFVYSNSSGINTDTWLRLPISKKAVFAINFPDFGLTTDSYFAEFKRIVECNDNLRTFILAPDGTNSSPYKLKNPKFINLNYKNAFLLKPEFKVASEAKKQDGLVFAIGDNTAALLSERLKTKVFNYSGYSFLHIIRLALCAKEITLLGNSAFDALYNEHELEILEACCPTHIDFLGPDELKAEALDISELTFSENSGAQFEKLIPDTLYMSTRSAMDFVLNQTVFDAQSNIAIIGTHAGLIASLAGISKTHLVGEIYYEFLTDGDTPYSNWQRERAEGLAVEGIDKSRTYHWVHIDLEEFDEKLISRAQELVDIRFSAGAVISGKGWENLAIKALLRKTIGEPEFYFEDGTWLKIT